MKKIIYIFIFIISIAISWCSQEKNTTLDTSFIQKDNISTTLNTWLNTWLQEPIQAIITNSTWWILNWFHTIEGILWPITISWQKIIYENIFSININIKEFYNRDYYKTLSGRNHSQQFALVSKDFSKNFYISTLNSGFFWKNFTYQDNCNSQTRYNWGEPFSKNITQKKINNIDIFFTKIVFFTKWNKPPYDYTYITHMCFIKNDIIYDIVFDNYPFNKAGIYLDSFKFLE